MRDENKPRDTVRFWFHWNGWTKLTLVGRDVPHTLYKSSPTDEGWSSQEETFTLTTDDEGNDVVQRETIHDGRDCDGRLTTSDVCICPVENLAAHEVDTLHYWQGSVDEPTDRLAMAKRLGDGETYHAPAWQALRSRQRDEYAEAMGY